MMLQPRSSLGRGSSFVRLKLKRGAAMKTDLDRLMQERGLDALIVVGPDGLGEVNAPFRYFVGDAHLTGMVLRKRGEPARLLHHDMERDAARATGLEAVSSSRWPLKEIFEAYSTHSEARVELYRRIFLDLGIGGRVLVTGIDDVSAALGLWDRLRAAIPSIEIVTEMDGTVLEEARMTKDPDELSALDVVARETCAVVEEARDVVANALRSENALADSEGVLTVGRLRAFVGERMHARGLTSPDGIILSTNEDAAVPHNVGDDDHVLAPGDVLLFDFFPRGRNGYWHDITRTWSIGTPRVEAGSAFADVQACFHWIMDRVLPGASTRELQQATCEFFEERGHTTIRQDPASTSGYVHSLGHGLGLEVHERPHFPSFRAGKDTRLEPGMVLTIEPGLYYPDRRVGVRLEDTVVVTETGARSLSSVPQDLELPSSSERGARRVGAARG
jgi:Xaa-Pro aminopeptidase